MSINRNFGIEMEIAVISQSQALTALRSAGLRAETEGYNHDTRPHWKIVGDASVRNGFEVVSPILQGESGLEEAGRAARALESAGAKINSTCGLHVHFSASDLSVNEIRTIATRYATYEAEIDAFMPRSRRANENEYCRSTREIFLNKNSFKNATTVEALVRAQGGRYFKLNLQSYSRYNTIEFRQHGGTVNATKIMNWVRFLNAFIDESRRLTAAPATANSQSLPHLQGAQARLANLLAGEGQSADALQNALNLLPHSLRAAISYLRRAGLAIESSRRNGTTSYRLAQGIVHTADSLFAGIDNSLRTFYRNRTATLA